MDLKKKLVDDNLLNVDQVGFTMNHGLDCCLNAQRHMYI